MSGRRAALLDRDGVLIEDVDLLTEAARIAPLAGVRLSFENLLPIVGSVFLVSFTLTGMGFIIAWQMDSSAGFHAIMNLLLVPMWMVSGSLFPMATAHGFVKVLTVPGKDRILGVTIVGEHAGDLLAEFVLAMKHGLGLNKILGTIHTYPTLAEANKYAAGEWKRAHAPQRILAGLELYHAWKRG